MGTLRVESSPRPTTEKSQAVAPRPALAAGSPDLGKTQAKWVAKPPSVPTPRFEFDDVNDRQHDGKIIASGGTVLPANTPLAAVKGLLPTNGAKVHGRAIFVNGIMTDLRLNRHNLQALANTGLEVVGVHNATEGMGSDFMQCVGDKLDLSRDRNPAIATVANLIEESLKNPSVDPPLFIGHSQGALIISNALSEVARRMKANGATEAQVIARLSKLHVETLGGASWTFPKGPKIRHIVNGFDPIALATGAGLELSGEDRRIVRMGHWGTLKTLPPLSQFSLLMARSTDNLVHGLTDFYADARTKKDP